MSDDDGTIYFYDVITEGGEVVHLTTEKKLVFDFEGGVLMVHDNRWASDQVIKFKNPQGFYLTDRKTAEQIEDDQGADENE